MKKLLFVLFALVVATVVIGVTTALVTRSTDAEPEAMAEETTA